MPAGAVKPGQEKYWELAKKQAAKQGREGDYAYIMGIFKKMTLNKSLEKGGDSGAAIYSSDRIPMPPQYQQAVDRYMLEGEAAIDDVFIRMDMHEVERCEQYIRQQNHRAAYLTSSCADRFRAVVHDLLGMTKSFRDHTRNIEPLLKA